MARRALVLLGSLFVTACASEPTGPAATAGSNVAAQTASVDVQALAPSEPASPGSAAPTSEAHATLSGSAPPAAPSAKAPAALSDARAAQISQELAQLDLKLLGELNGEGTTVDNVLKSGEIPQLLSSPANAAMGKGSQPGLGELRAGSGGGGGLADLGGGSGQAKVADAGGAKLSGKSLSAATSADLEKAVADAGCSSTRLDSPSKAGVIGKVIVLAKCADKSFTVTFIPSGAPAPDATTLEEMSKGGARIKEGDAILAVKPVSGEDGAGSRALLDKLLKRSTPPKGSASISQASVSGGKVDNASAVVAGMAAGFRRCYVRGLTDEPKMQGSLEIVVSVGPAGEVTSAVPKNVKGVSATVASCAAGVASSRSFDKPEGGAAKITIPLSFRLPEN